MTPIYEFLNLANLYESSNPPSLQLFIHWLESGNNEIKRNVDSINNEVRIMTVHGAKGLQSPIVFLPDTTSISNTKMEYLIDDNIFLCPALSEFQNQYFKAHKNTIEKNEHEESMRLLYVAITRAEDELYIYGGENRESNREDKWYNVIKKQSQKNIIKKIRLEKLLYQMKNIQNYFRKTFIYRKVKTIKQSPFLTIWTKKSYKRR